MTVLDFSAGLPDPGKIKLAGHDGVMLYCSPARESWMRGKQPPRAYLDRLDAAGIKFGFVWQFRAGGSVTAGDAGRGRAGGVDDARQAQRYLDDVSCSGHPVYFAVDWDISLAEWNTAVADYFRGAASVLGKQRVGIYGHSRVVHWAMEDAVVADVAPGRVLGWVTSSWSGGHTGVDYATLWQGTHNVPGPDGVHVDINTPYVDEWGWRALPPGQVARGDAHEAIDFLAQIKPVWLNKHYTPGRGGRTIKKIVLHHMGGIGDAHKCYQWWQTRQASAHYAVDRYGGIGQLVRESDTAWANANSVSNQESLTIEHSNDGGPDKDWPISEATRDAGAKLVAALLIKHGLGAPKFGVNITTHDIESGGKTACPYHLRRGHKYHADYMARVARYYQAFNTEQEIFMALTDDEQRRLLAHIDMLATQALGPEGGPNGGRGWQQLGSNSSGQYLTVVDAIAALRHDVNDLKTEIKEDL